MIAYISIGNSDDKLSQREWSLFCKQLVDEIIDFSLEVHGIWYSESSAQYQNMCICADVDETEAGLRYMLGVLAAEWRQDSIALTVGETEFIAP